MYMLLFVCLAYASLTEREEKAFRELKERFTKEPVLAAPDIPVVNRASKGL